MRPTHDPEPKKAQKPETYTFPSKSQSRPEFKGWGEDVFILLPQGIITHSPVSKGHEFIILDDLDA